MTISPTAVGPEGAVGFIGLRNMGGRMSRCIVRAPRACARLRRQSRLITTPAR